jgi:hypothetical protein
MPCSVNGVLNTRFLPGVLFSRVRDGRRTELFSETHGASEHATERHVLSEHDRLVVCAQCGTDPSACRSEPSPANPRASRTAWYKFMRRVSRPLPLNPLSPCPSVNFNPGVARASSRVRRRIFESPSAGSGFMSSCFGDERAGGGAGLPVPVAGSVTELWTALTAGARVHLRVSAVIPAALRILSLSLSLSRCNSL